MAAAAAAVKKVAAATAAGDGTAADSRGLPQAAIAAFERNSEPVSAPPAEAAPVAAHNADAPLPQAETLAHPAAPLKDISLQVTQPGKESVDVRVVQQGSEVRISVSSADAGLASGLRQGLSELQGRLEENGYRAEMWRPGGFAAPAGPAPAAQTEPGHARGGDSQSQSGGSPQDGGRRNQQQSNQPRWVEELESSLTGEMQPGGSHGFSS
jgi:hypothetical protein